MTTIREIALPGVGVRYEFTTEAGEQVGVIVHRGGRREMMVYDADDPERCTTVLHLTPDDTQALAELMGGPTVRQVATAVEQHIEGLAIDWVVVADGSAFVGRTIADGMIRTRTGVSIVAVMRDLETFPSPEPDFVFSADDVAVAIGTPEGIAQVRAMLA
jgi:TrkA domain protein